LKLSEKSSRIQFVVSNVQKAMAEQIGDGHWQREFLVIFAGHFSGNFVEVSLAIFSLADQLR